MCPYFGVVSLVEPKNSLWACASSLGSGEVFIVKDVYGVLIQERYGAIVIKRGSQNQFTGPSSVDNRFYASVRLVTFLVLGDHLTGPKLGRSGYQNSSSVSCSLRLRSSKIGVVVMGWYDEPDKTASCAGLSHRDPFELETAAG
ncbi:hypothetical protein F2Q70_00022444 [Brassica cretica]|uniref:Uncharacterized protein n=1 Tax=Brassica cretica TaxID=69181 RepID=A0A8S9GYH5_BRACR|nr:hypothetical protein F2Q70_00022444 [Brassica cretica]